MTTGVSTLAVPPVAAVAEKVRDIARMELSRDDIAVRRKRDGSIVTEVDMRIEDRLADALGRDWPDIAVYAEERPSEAARRAPAVWVLDPLDGTTNFAGGLPYYSVSLALVIAGHIELGVVYDPVRDECFTGRRGQGASVNGSPLAARARSDALEQAIAVVDFKRLSPALRQALAQDPPYASQRNLGSCSLEWCWLAAGRFQLYLHGRQKAWDYAAGALIASESEAAVATLEGGDFESVAALEPQSVVAAATPKLLSAFAGWLRGRAV